MKLVGRPEPDDGKNDSRFSCMKVYHTCESDSLVTVCLKGVTAWCIIDERSQAIAQISARRDKYLITCRSRDGKKVELFGFDFRHSRMPSCRHHASTILDLHRNTPNDFKNPQDFATSQDEMCGLGFDRGVGGWKTDGRCTDHLRLAQQDLKDKLFIFLDLSLRRTITVDDSTSPRADGPLEIHFPIRLDWETVSVVEEYLWHPGRI